ncbi:alpha/beta fold hydrolase [Amycolatopsis sp. CA-128772]|uniref:alpha/beta fold hydrolase n=1 Tax=Amycolatopsis sp. CA-128772 TaxID=2073159 RepID=UPI000CD1634F|nr:alpha/beta hydrolase [Amycolatopsis sp. CA-128772]
MIGGFRSARSENRYLAAYDRIAARWPVPVRDVDVGTRYGPTRVRVSGDTGPPIVLLPGLMGTSLSWYPHVADLAARHRVYAVDTIGEPGRSRQTRPATTGDDCAGWLHDVLDGLGPGKFLLAGVSRGAWLALTLAARTPDRIAGVVAVEPPGFAPIGRRFLWWSVREVATWFDPRPRAAVRRTLRPLLFGGLTYRAHHPPEYLFTDEQLRAVAVPVRLVLGERSVIHAARDVEQRVEALNPLFDVEIVPRATHALPLQRPELVTARILTA